jgi:hypothetical protein
MAGSIIINALPAIQNNLYKSCALQISDFMQESESKEYKAVQFQLNGLHIICRTAKITPKKVGLFVTFWKRSKDGPIAPFHKTDPFDLFVINVQQEGQYGQFVIPKSELQKRGLISSETKEGKRGFRVYPAWDITQNKQAQRTQKWQLNYFIEINHTTNTDATQALYTSQ